MFRHLIAVTYGYRNSREFRNIHLKGISIKGFTLFNSKVVFSFHSKHNTRVFLNSRGVINQGQINLANFNRNFTKLVREFHTKCITCYRSTDNLSNGTIGQRCFWQVISPSPFAGRSPRAHPTCVLRYSWTGTG